MIEIEEILRIDQLTSENRPFRPYGQSYDILYAKEPEVLATGPAGTGKSRSILEKIHLLMSEFPEARALFLRSTRRSLTEAALVTFENKVVPRGHQILRGAKRAHRQSYDYGNGSTIAVAGLDDNTMDRVLSTEYDIIYAQEATELPEEVWETALTRLRNNILPYQQIIGDCNPDRPKHWLKLRCDSGRCKLIQTKHQDNPTLYDHGAGDWTDLGRFYLGKILGNLTGHRRRRFLLGEWVVSEGARFPQLEESVHLFKFSKVFPHGIPSSWVIYLGIDYGQRDPYCCLWIAVDENKNLWVFREDYCTGLTPDQQAERVVHLTGRNERVRQAFADPSMWNKLPNALGLSVMQDKCVADFFDMAFRLDPRFGALSRGFNKSRFQAMATLDSLFNRGNGYPDIYIEEGCKNLWDELTSAVWDEVERRSGKKEDIDPRCADHAITALYYMAHSFYYGAPLPLGDVPTGAEIRQERLEEIYANDVVEFDRQLAAELRANMLF